MNKTENARFLIRLHQVIIMVLFVFSLFVKPEVKKFFWMIIAAGALSLLIQELLYRADPGLFGDKVEKQPHEM
jgi:phosphoglycerol transferase MdoB-like AlkP superfamily enzyme